VPASRLFPHDESCRNLLIVAATETTSAEDCDTFCSVLAECLT
jgi:hypothetical protein